MFTLSIFLCKRNNQQECSGKQHKEDSTMSPEEWIPSIIPLPWFTSSFLGPRKVLTRGQARPNPYPSLCTYPSKGSLPTPCAELPVSENDHSGGQNSRLLGVTVHPLLGRSRFLCLMPDQNERTVLKYESIVSRDHNRVAWPGKCCVTGTQEDGEDLRARGQRALLGEESAPHMRGASGSSRPVGSYSRAHRDHANNVAFTFRTQDFTGTVSKHSCW